MSCPQSPGPNCPLTVRTDDRNCSKPCQTGETVSSSTYIVGFLDEFNDVAGVLVQLSHC